VTRPPRLRTGADAIAGAAPTRAPRRAPFVVLVLAVMLGALTCLLVLNTLSAADELEQQSIADDNAVTKAQAQQLRVDLAAREAPAALARAATDLGLVPADKPAFLRIGADGKVTLLGVPGAVSPPPIVLEPPAAAGTASTPSADSDPGATPTTTTAPAAPPTAPAVTSTPTTTVTLPGGAR
jgi:hypothetical protein